MDKDVNFSVEARLQCLELQSDSKAQLDELTIQQLGDVEAVVGPSRVCRHKGSFSTQAATDVTLRYGGTYGLV